VADKRHTAGYYVNVIFEIEPNAVDPLKRRFSLSDDVFRVMFTNAAVAKAAA
jgi:ribosomal protein S6